MGDGLIDLPAASQSQTKVVVGLGIVGLDLQRLPILGDGLIHVSAVGQNPTQVAVDRSTGGIDFQRLPKLAIASSTRPQASRAAPRLAWAKAFCEVQARVRVHRVSLSCQKDACRHAHPIRVASTNARADAGQPTIAQPTPTLFAHSPDQSNTNSNLRQVGESVGHRLMVTCTTPITGTNIPKYQSQPTST